MMAEDGIIIMPMDPENEQNAGQGHSFIVRRALTSLLNVYVDGRRLPGNGKYYRVEKNPEGLFTITLTSDFVKTLEKGNHTLTMDFDRLDDIR